MGIYRTAKQATCGLPELQQVQLARTSRSFGAIGHIEFGQDVVDMPLGRTHADDKGIGDLPVGHALGKQAEYVTFLFAEGFDRRRGGRGAPQTRADGRCRADRVCAVCCQSAQEIVDED